MAIEETLIPSAPEFTSSFSFDLAAADILFGEFDTLYCGMDPSSQAQLDELLGFRFKENQYLLFSDDHQHNPHLFLRICFFLIGKSFVALQAWVAISRLGFDRDLRAHDGQDGTVDVVVFQLREGYAINMEVRLKDATRFFNPPEWLFSQPLPIPSPPYPIFGEELVTTGARLGDNNLDFDKIIGFQDPTNGVTSDASLDSFLVSQTAQSASNPLGTSTLSRVPTIVNETSLFTANRPPSLPWLTPFNPFSSFKIDSSDSDLAGSTTPGLNDPYCSQVLHPPPPSGNKLGLGLSRTPTIIDEAPSASQAYSGLGSGSARSFYGITRAKNGSLTRIPTLLNAPRLSAAQVPAPSLPGSPFSGTTVPGTNGIQRSETVSTILAFDGNNSADGDGSTRPDTVSDTSGYSREKRFVRSPSENEYHNKPRSLASLGPFTRSELQLLDPVPRPPSQTPNRASTPTVQRAIPNAGMDVDPLPSESKHHS